MLLRKVAGTGGEGPLNKTRTFISYNLQDLPEEASPLADQEYKGKQSFTVWIGEGAT